MAKKNHTSDQKPKRKCEQCDKLFDDRGALENHMKAKEHFNNQCVGCNKRFANQHERRMVRVHLQVRLYLEVMLRGYVSAF